jgi:hypothetical protein
MQIGVEIGLLFRLTAVRGSLRSDIRQFTPRLKTPYNPPTQNNAAAETMVNATLVNNRDVEATLSFITPTSRFNRRYVAPGEEINTGVYEDKKVIIQDARPNRDKFKLDTNGFSLLEHQSKVTKLRSNSL